MRERIFRDIASFFDRGYLSVDLGQPDGFRECQCADCEALHGTGKDWSEKIWISHREIAERLAKSHPGKQVTMMSYILTAEPPKSFSKFPDNTSVMLTGTNEEDIAPWRGIEVPRGFTGYVYNWCPNLATRYTPMRTPAISSCRCGASPKTGSSPSTATVPASSSDSRGPSITRWAGCSTIRSRTTRRTSSRNSARAPS